MDIKDINNLISKIFEKIKIFFKKGPKIKFKSVLFNDNTGKSRIYSKLEKIIANLCTSYMYYDILS